MLLPAEVPFETHPEQWPGLLTMLHSKPQLEERFSNAHVPTDLAEVEVGHVDTSSFQTHPCAFCGKQEGFTGAGRTSSLRGTGAGYPAPRPARRMGRRRTPSTRRWPFNLLRRARRHAAGRSAARTA